MSLIILVEKKEAVTGRCSVKKVFLKISQNSLENACAGVFFLIKLQDRPATLLKEKLQHGCFPVNFVKFLRAPFFIEHLLWLLLKNSIIFPKNSKTPFVRFLNTPLSESVFRDQLYI